MKEFKIEELEQRIAPSSADFPPGQFPSGNPAHAPGRSNPNEELSRREVGARRRDSLLELFDLELFHWLPLLVQSFAV